ALGHRRLAGEQRGGGLLGTEPAECAQRQRDPGLGGERRMAAGEDEPQLVVLDHVLTWLGHARLQQLDRLPLLPAAQTLAAQGVQRLAPRGHREPGARALGHAGARPVAQRGDDRLLDGVLREAQVADRTDQGGEDARALGPYGLGEGDRRGGRCRSTHGVRYSCGRGTGCTGRTSTAPCQAAGICAAALTASSRSAHSSRKKPVRTSLVSAYGPSLTTTSPPRAPWTRTTVAVEAASRASPPRISAAFSIANS